MPYEQEAQEYLTTATTMYCEMGEVVRWRATHGPLSASVTTASELHDRVRPLTGGDMDMRCWLKQAEVDKSKL